MQRIYKKKKLTFIDIDFHKKTKSGLFLYKYLSQFFNVNFKWVKSKNNKFIFDPSYHDLKPKLFFFQYLPDIKSLYSLRNKSFFWAPMYDDIKKKNYLFWIVVSLFNINIISFSKKINLICKRFNINYIYLKYFPVPKKIRIKRKKKVVIFFWYRGTVKLSDWINDIDHKKVKKIIYFNLKDPNFNNEKISLDLKKKYNIVFYKGLFGKKDFLYKKLLESCDIYIAPREREGIGHSFLEAMARGKYIISKNEETMNEYIVSDKIGNFFGNKCKIDNVLFYQNERIRYAKKLYKSWENKKIRLIKFINI